MQQCIVFDRRRVGRSIADGLARIATMQRALARRCGCLASRSRPRASRAGIGRHIGPGTARLYRLLGVATLVMTVAGCARPHTAQEQYAAAFERLRVGDYQRAAQEFRAFLAQYPNDRLAPKAEYWLGESYYAQNDLVQAAAVFAEGLEKYPHGEKAADSVLKLGMVLGYQGRRLDACSTLDRLDRDYPQMTPIVKDHEIGERQLLRC